MICAILVDNETSALQSLAQKLHSFKGVEIVNTFSSPPLMLESIPNLVFNTFFLAMEVPEMNGIDLAEKITDYDPSICIVFVSAYRDYAVEAFEIDSIDYLLKPISDARLQKTIFRLKVQLADSKVFPLETVEPLHIYSFPEFIVYCGGEPVKWKTTKVKELFAHLLTYHRNYINRDVLTDTLWPDTDYAKAKVQLHTAISYLRKTLEAMGHSKVITFANQSYCLDLQHFQFDASNIEHLLQTTNQAFFSDQL